MLHAREYLPRDGLRTLGNKHHHFSLCLFIIDIGPFFLRVSGDLRGIRGLNIATQATSMLDSIVVCCLLSTLSTLHIVALGMQL